MSFDLDLAKRHTKENCTATPNAESIELGRLGRRVIEGRLDGGNMTSVGGVMLLSATYKKLGFMDSAARCITEATALPQSTTITASPTKPNRS